MAEVFSPTGEQLYDATRFTHDSSGGVINPSTKEGQEAQNAALNALGTEATQLLIKTGIEAIGAKDSATGAKQDEIKTALSALATEQKLELVRLLLVDIQTKLGSVDVASLPAISGEVSVNNLPQTQQVAGTVQVGNFPAEQAIRDVNYEEVRKVTVANPLPGTQNVNVVNPLPGVQEVDVVSPLPGVTNVEVCNFPATQNVSGSVSINGKNDTIKSAPVTGAKTITATAAEVFAGASRLANRYQMTIQNVDTLIIYIGAAGVTTAGGFPLLPGDSLTLSFKPDVATPIYAISTGSCAVRVVELA